MERHRAILRVSYSWLDVITKSGTYSIQNSSVPSTAQFLTARYDPLTDEFHLLYEDESFAPVPEGQRLPFLDDVVIKKHKSRRCP